MRNKMKANLVLALTLLPAVLFCSCSRRAQKSIDQTPQATAYGFPDKDLATRNNHFALDLLRQLPIEEQNAVFSPFSISAALAMTYAGARNLTAQQMVNTLNFDPDQETFHLDYQQYLEVLSELAKGDVRLNVANSIWAQQDYHFLPDYFAKLQAHYQAKVQQVNYRADREAIRLQINQWVYEETREKIEDLIPPMVLTPDTRMVLVNAIHFFGPWQKEFDKELTQTLPFHNIAGEKTLTDFMFRKDSFSYYEDETCQALELPYSEEGFSMVLMLPSEDISLQEFEIHLSADKFSSIIDQMQKKNAEIFIPRFEANTKINLEEVLSAMGMPEAFSNKADFSGMTGYTDLKIDQIIHQAVIEVQEEGTEAAAATAVVMIVKTSVGMDEEKIVFRADRPFLFAIKDNTYNSILFMGRVVQL
jgi:serpin B